MKDFSECCFKIYLLELKQENKYIELSFKLLFSDNPVTTKLACIAIRTKDGDYNFDDSDVYNISNKLHVIKKVLAFNHKPFVNDSKLILFFAQEDKNIFVEYDVQSIDLIKLCQVDVQVKKNIAVTKETNSLLINHEKRSNHVLDYDASSDWTRNNKFLASHVAALCQEIYYLKHEGGKKHKVTNGKLIRRYKGKYAYAFDLESELYISDDSPISLMTDGKYRIAGTVMMCEDFQMILVLNDFIGEKVSTAFVTVEPWKLLEAMIKHTAYAIDHNNRITLDLVNIGPVMATELPVEKIIRGQDAAVRHVRDNAVTLIWGPPGTGKTHTIASIAIKALKSDKSVLIVSHSNVSVDGVAGKIAKILRDREEDSYLREGKVLRYGFVRDENLRIDEQVSSFRYVCQKNKELSEKLDELTREKDKEKNVHGIASDKYIQLNNEIKRIRNIIREDERVAVQNAKIVVTTVSKLLIDEIFADRKYDMVMFDEVSMAYVFQVLAASGFAKKRFVCVGDFMQLAPIAQSPAREVLSEDIFSYLGISKGEQIYYHPWLVLLDEQRRMYPDISEFSNRYVYHRLLKDHPCVIDNNIDTVNDSPFSGNAINLINLVGCYCAADKNEQNSRFNILSALITFASAYKTVNSRKVSIITPYSAQTRLIRAMLSDLKAHDEKVDIKCATVHQFQGSESDVIYFDAVESYPGKKPGWLMDKNLNSIKRLINVALTRAKGKLITVANKKFWDDNYKDKANNHTFYKLLNFIEKYGNVVSHKNDSSLENHIRLLNIDKFMDFYLDNTYSEKLTYDIIQAKKEIIVSFPRTKKDENVPKSLMNLLEQKQLYGVSVSLKCDDVVFPLIIIDNKVVWYGAPFDDWTFERGNLIYKTVCPIACRIKGNYTVEMIKSLTSIEFKKCRNLDSGLEEKSNSLIDDEADGKELSGLAGYINENLKCAECGSPLALAIGKSKKPYLKCSSCGEREYLTPDEVNKYIRLHNVTCPIHHMEIRCGLSRYGLYVKCRNEHYLKVEEL